MALTLNPITNPDDLRAEADKVPTHAAVAAAQPPATDAAPAPASPDPGTPVVASTPASVSGTSDDVTTTMPAAPAPEPEQEWRPYQTLGSITPAVPPTPGLATPTNLNTGDVTFGGYTYMVPAGIYVIVALSAAAALLYWVLIIFFKLHRVWPIVEALVITVFGLGLLTRNAIIRYGAIAASAIGAAYMAYQSIKLLQFASTDIGALFSSFGYGGYAMGVIVIYLAITIALAACCGYLMMGRVGRAFH